MGMVEESFRLNSIVLIPNSPENTHIKVTPEDIGVWNMIHPRIPDRTNNNNDHKKSLEFAVSLYVR